MSALIADRKEKAAERAAKKAEKEQITAEAKAATHRERQKRHVVTKQGRRRQKEKDERS
jgi:hypothetical protein